MAIGLAAALVLAGIAGIALVGALYGVTPAILAGIGGALVTTGMFAIDVDREA